MVGEPVPSVQIPIEPNAKSFVVEALVGPVSAFRDAAARLPQVDDSCRGCIGRHPLPPPPVSSRTRRKRAVVASGGQR
eukprot:scaffold35341_cov56-Isochrysis_galbana.AAC.1